MQFRNISIYLLFFYFNFINLVISPDPEESSNGTGDQESRKSSDSGKKSSVASSPRKSTYFGSRLALPSTSSRSGTGLGFNISSSLGSSVVLDFDSSEISNDFEVQSSIPGILKYSLKASGSGNFRKIKGNGKELSFSKNIDYVLCNSPFDNNVTVVFQDETSEEYYLKDGGFELGQEEQGEQASEQEQAPVAIPRINITGIELNLLDASDEFSYEEIGNIKCYKPKEEGHVVSKIKLDNSLRILESDIQENFVCMIEESGTYSIMVAYLSENKWRKYTLSRMPSSIILMDVTLIRKFEQVVPETLFVDKLTPEDEVEFEYKGLVVNTNSSGMMKSKTTGNKLFVLTVTNADKTTTKQDIHFDKHFNILDGFRFYAIRSKQDFSEMIFSYTNENAVLHEKFVKIEDKYHKDVKTVYKNELARTKSYLSVNETEERVLYMKSLVPDCIEQGLQLSHYGKFKVVDFEKSTVPTFVIFPNLEFYLKKDIQHRLILCENGRNISFILDTETNNKRMKYIVGTDPIKGNPFSIMARIDHETDNEPNV